MVRGRSKNAGFTLIEIVVVITIVASMMGIVATFVGDSERAEIKKLSTRLVASALFAYNEAASKNHIHRLVFDLEDQAYWLEAGPEVFVLGQKKDNEKKAEAKDDSAKKNAEAVTPEAEAPTEDSIAKKTVPPATAPAEEFAPVDSFDFKKVSLNQGIKFRDVYVGHQEAPVESGKAYLYFFPNGQTEVAVIHLGNEDQSLNYSVIINPLTGRGDIRFEYVDFDEAFPK